MPDAQKTIEILLQFKQQNPELIQKVIDAVAAIEPAATGAAAAVTSIGTDSAAAVEQATAPMAKLQEELTATAATAQTTAAAVKEVGGAAASMAQETAASVKEVGASVAAAGSKMQGLGSQAKSAIGEVSSAFGRGSPFEQFVKALSGGGAVLGLGLLGTKLSEMGRTLVELKAQFNAGSISALDFGEKLAESIPVFGEFYKAGESFRELITGQQAAMNADNEAAKELNKTVDLYSAQMKAGKQVTQDFTDKLIALRNQMELLQTPFDQRKNVKNLQDLGTALRDLGREFVDKANGKPFDLGLLIPADFDRKIEQMRNAVAEQRKAVSQAAKDLAAASVSKPDDASNVGFGVDATPDTREADAQKIFDDQEKVLAILNNQLAALDQLVTAQAAYKASVKETVDIYQQNQFTGAIEEVVKGWTGAWNAVVKYGTEAKKTNTEQLKALAEQGKQLKESLETPLQKYQEDLGKLQSLMTQGVITPETFAADKKLLDDALAKAQEAVDQANAKKIEEADETQVLISQGVDKQLSEAKLAYDRDVEAFSQALAKKAIDEAQYEEAVKTRAALLTQDQLRIQHQAAAQKQAVEDEYNVAIAAGIDQQSAQAKQSYDRDVAAWQDALDQKQISSAQFDAYQVSRAKLLQQQLDAIAQQKHEAGYQTDILVDQANHQPQAAALAQVDLETSQLKAQWTKYYQDGLLSDLQYQNAINAIDKQAGEKKLMVNGSVFDGLKMGFQNSVDAMKTAAQDGAQIAGDFTNGLVDTFTSIVTGSKTAAQAFSQFALSIIQEIAKMVIEFEILNIVKGILGSFGGGSAGAPTGVTAVNQGGLIPGYALGGLAGGGAWGPNKDTLPAMLTPGEFVVRRQAVQMPGVLSMLRSINSGMAAMPRASAGQLGSIAPAGVGSGGGGGGGGGPQIVPAVIASDANVRTLLAGGRNAVIDFLRSNKNQVNAALGGT